MTMPPDGNTASPSVRVFLAGDVMLGRGIDQILPHPSDPVLFERHVASAIDYVRLAERRCGPIQREVSFEYVWGDLLDDLDQRRCNVRLINLETAITTSDRAAAKGINYRMNPENAPVLAAARIDACILGNNHVMDWGRVGLVETLQVLSRAGCAQVGAGRTHKEASTPVALEMPGLGRILLVAFGAESSGVPPRWAAEPDKPGINLLPDDIAQVIRLTRQQVEPVRGPHDVVVFSVHWGGNWGYSVEPAQRALAHALIDEAGVDILYGHSTHHPKAVEVYHGKLILYGCGDLINDYEGISGHEAFRGDLALGYVADICASDGTLQSLEMLPYRIRAFRLQRADSEEKSWLANTMDRECAAFGGHVTQAQDGVLQLSWN